MVHRDWFRSYFTEPYSEVYAEYLVPRHVARHEADFVFRALDLQADDRILDCPCGYGRHMQALLPRCPGIVGVDLEPDCLRRAAQQSPEAGVLRGDMRALPVATQSCDVVLNLFNSFGYFGDHEDRAALREFARVLRPAGRVLLDVANPGPLREIVDEQPRTEHCVYDLVFTEDWLYDPETGTLRNQTRIERSGRETVRRSYEVRLYSLKELKAMLTTCGLRVEEVYGDFDGRDFDPEAMRQIVIARRLA